MKKSREYHIKSHVFDISVSGISRGPRMVRVSTKGSERNTYQYALFILLKFQKKPKKKLNKSSVRNADSYWLNSVEK